VGGKGAMLVVLSGWKGLIDGFFCIKNTALLRITYKAAGCFIYLQELWMLHRQTKNRWYDILRGKLLS